MWQSQPNITTGSYTNKKEKQKRYHKRKNIPQCNNRHRPVTLWQRIKSTRPANIRQKIGTINLKKIENAETQKQIYKTVTEAYNSIKEEKSIQEEWQIFKETIINASQIHCGMKFTGRKKKLTIWWNEEVKTTIQNKKQAFKIWQKSRQTEEYNNYKDARKE